MARLNYKKTATKTAAIKKEPTLTSKTKTTHCQHCIKQITNIINKAAKEGILCDVISSKSGRPPRYEIPQDELSRWMDRLTALVAANEAKIEADNEKGVPEAKTFYHKHHKLVDWADTELNSVVQTYMADEDDTDCDTDDTKWCDDCDCRGGECCDICVDIDIDN